jgi:hypothetical protein
MTAPGTDRATKNRAVTINATDSNTGFVQIQGTSVSAQTMFHRKL